MFFSIHPLYIYPISYILHLISYIHSLDHLRLTKRIIHSIWSILEAPKLSPLSALDRYPEGADLKLFCSASATANGGKLQFEWRKDPGDHLLSSTQVKSSSNKQSQRTIQISQMDDSTSVLRINQLEADDSGNYTCLARNQLGQDASTVRINVNGEQ